jgi:hypothetical protein
VTLSRAETKSLHPTFALSTRANQRSHRRYLNAAREENYRDAIVGSDSAQETPVVTTGGVGN